MKRSRLTQNDLDVIIQNKREKILNYMDLHWKDYQGKDTPAGNAKENQSSKQNNTEDAALKALLKSWVGLPDPNYIYSRCLSHEISIRELMFLEKDDLSDLMPVQRLGDRIMFRYHLYQWKTEVIRRVATDDITASQKQTLNWVKDVWKSPPSSQEESGASTSASWATSASQEIDLEEILESSASGHILEMAYKENKNKFFDEERQILADAVVEHYLTLNKPLTPEDMQKFAEAIVKKFPTERMHMFYSNLRQTRKRRKGLIYERYHEVKKKLTTQFKAIATRRK